MSGLVSGARALRDRLAAHATLADATLNGGAGAAAPPLPDYVVHVLARLRLLEGVPFQYLVPDPRLLPAESARFFTLDPAWLDQLCLGALAVGAGGTREQAQAELALAPARQALGRQLPLVRDLQRGRLVLENAVASAAAEVDPAGAVTGVLIRSALVTGWPSVAVRAYTTDDTALVPDGADPGGLEQAHPELTVPVLRLALLNPSVLLVLFAGVPRLVWLEEPHHGVQFGVEETAAGGHDVPLRTEAGDEPGTRIAVPARARGGSLGVVDVAAFAASVRQARGLAQAGSAQVALELMRAPARQRFGASTPPPP